MRIHSYNEWDKLREIVVGDASRANWPSNDPVFAEESKKTTWKETPVPSGPVPFHIIEEANEDLEILAGILEQAGVVVHRPAWMDFQGLGGMYNYCPRDRFLVAGDKIVDPAMMYPCRDMEWKTLAKVIAGNHVKYMPRNEGMTLDAANVCRLGDTWLYLESWSGNHAAYEWLCEQFPAINIEKCNFYSGVHIDSTIVPLCEGTVMINASRVQKDNIPAAFKDWRIIWISDEDIVEQLFYQYPYASKWIGMNTLSIDSTTVIVDAIQSTIIKKLELTGFTVVPHTLRHSRTLGGGLHCVTLDTWRED
jgi:scyllo-inosamine-4-phosphate amidinotransferase 1